MEEDLDTFDMDLMNMDFEGIFELSAPHTSASFIPETSTSSLQTPSSMSPSIASSDPFHFAPTPGAPSMQIERQVAYSKATKASKETKSKVLNAFTSKLLNMCPLCWAYQGILDPKHNNGL